MVAYAIYALVASFAEPKTERTVKNGVRLDEQCAHCSISIVQRKVMRKTTEHLEFYTVGSAGGPFRRLYDNATPRA